MSGCGRRWWAGRFRAAPEIVIEILSPGVSNAARGAGEYWIVDPENRSIEVDRGNDAGELVFEKSLLQGADLTSGVLPGFTVCVDALFV